jgi:hypothetical protein
LQNVSFVFPKILVGCGDAQIADDAEDEGLLFLVTVKLFEGNVQSTFVR